MKTITMKLTASPMIGGVTVLYLAKGSSPWEAEGVTPDLSANWAVVWPGAEAGACAGRAGGGPPFLGGGGGSLIGPLFVVEAAVPEDCPLDGDAPVGYPRELGPFFSR